MLIIYSLFLSLSVRYAVHNISFVLQILYKITVNHGEVTSLTVTPTPGYTRTHTHTTYANAARYTFTHAYTHAHICNKHTQSKTLYRLAD